MKKSVLMILCMILSVSLVFMHVSAEGEEGSDRNALSAEAEEQSQKEENSPLEQDEDSDEPVWQESEGNTADFLEEPSRQEEENPAEEAENETSGESEALETVNALIDNGIPVLSLTIDPKEYQKVIESEDHSYQASDCSISIAVPEGYRSEYSEEILSDLNDLALEYIRGRGNTTWVEEKKPFKFKLRNSTDLLGMGKNRHWVLLANAKDASLLRNRLTMYMGRKLGLEFTPKMVPVDFVVNGEYKGSYVLSEQVRIGKNRVNIDELTPDDNEEPEVTGGYLLTMDPYDREPEENKINTEKLCFGAESPSFAEEGTDDQKNYITSYLQMTEDAVYEEGDGYRDFLDAESAAKYWWVQELTCNSDAFSTPSTYLYKKRSGTLYFGPLWDFDLAYDKNYTAVTAFSHSKMAWLDQLRAYNPGYLGILKRVWQEYDSILEDIVKEGGVLDCYALEIQDSWQMDQTVIVQGETSLKEEIEELRSFLISRRENINETLEEDLDRVFYRITFTDGEGTVLKDYDLYVGYFLREEDFPEAPKKEGYTFLGWEDQNGRKVRDDTQPESDLLIHPAYIRNEDVIHPAKIYFLQDEVYESVNIFVYSAGSAATVVPFDALNRSLSWSVSDPEMAEVYENGTVMFLNDGDVTVTAEAENGVTASFLLHILPREKERELVSKITFRREEVVLAEGEYGQNPFALDPEDAFFILSFSSDNTDVVTVDENGVLHAVSPGRAVITALEGYTEQKAVYTVTVTGKKEDDRKDSGDEGKKEKKTDAIASAALLEEPVKYRAVNTADETCLGRHARMLVLSLLSACLDLFFLQRYR